MGEVVCLFACVCNSRLPTCPKFIGHVTQGPDTDHRYNLMNQKSYRIKCCWRHNSHGNAHQVAREQAGKPPKRKPKCHLESAANSQLVPV